MFVYLRDARVAINLARVTSVFIGDTDAPGANCAYISLTAGDVVRAETARDVAALLTALADASDYYSAAALRAFRGRASEEAR